MFVDHRVVSLFQENSYLLGCPETREAALIDPGDEPEAIWDMVQSSRLKVTKILGTHAHIDHIGAVAEMKRRTGAPFYLHPKDKFWINHLVTSAQVFGLPSPEKPTIDHPLEDGQILDIGHLQIRVLHTPGHSEGHVSFLVLGHEAVFSGDCLFGGSIGRTDLHGGSFETLMASIQEKLLSLPDQTKVYSGHGPATTIGLEKANNPFLSELR